MQGIVKFFNTEKGFGFIVIEDSEELVVVHEYGLTGPIRAGDRVFFELERGKKGMMAVRVEVTA
jgi:cold shock protein